MHLLWLYWHRLLRLTQHHLALLWHKSLRKLVAGNKTLLWHKALLWHKVLSGTMASVRHCCSWHHRRLLHHLLGWLDELLGLLVEANWLAMRLVGLLVEDHWLAMRLHGHATATLRWHCIWGHLCWLVAARNARSHHVTWLRWWHLRCAAWAYGADA